MPKLNAQVSIDTREQIRFIAGEYQTTVQAVTALALALGLHEMKSIPMKSLRKRLQPDGRKQNGK